MIKNMRRTVGLTGTILLIVLLIVASSAQASYRRGDGSAFPESHKDFLGASSYAAMFGYTQERLSPGPSLWHLKSSLPPIVGPNVQVNDPQLPFPDGLLGRSETTITTNRTGDRLVAGWNDADGFCGPPFNAPCPHPATPGLSGYGYSTDRGETWTDGGAPPVSTKIGFGPGPGDTSVSGVYITRGDPSMNAGRYLFYYANLAVFDDFLGSTGGVSVHTGRFKSDNFWWLDNKTVLLQSPNYPDDFLDKEHIAVDPSGVWDKIYVTVTNFAEVEDIPQFGFGQIEAYYSVNGGKTWNRSIIQPDETISVADNTGVIDQGSEPAVGPDGTVYVVWERGWLSSLTGGFVTPEIRVAKSTDHGATWTPAAALPPSSGINPAGVLVSKTCSGALFPPAGYNRGTTNDFPRITVAQEGEYSGRVYVTWHDCRIANGGTQEETGGDGNFDTDIYLSFSDDGGDTWSAPVLVAGGGDGKIQFWPDVTILKRGDVNVIYYESEETGDTSLVDLYLARSTDGGANFEAPVRVSEVTTDWGDTASNIIPNFGDYNTAVSAGNRVYATWADGRNGVPDVFFALILELGG